MDMDVAQSIVCDMNSFLQEYLNTPLSLSHNLYQTLVNRLFPNISIHYTDHHPGPILALNATKQETPLFCLNAICGDFPYSI